MKKSVLTSKITKKIGQMNNFRKCIVKTGDLVQVITGKEKGKKGKIIEVDRKLGYVKVEGLKMQTHFRKNSGMEVKEGPMHISNVMLFDQEKQKITRKKIIIQSENKENTEKSE